jgi:hypothetical protein
MFVFSLKRTINRGNLQTQSMVTHQEVGEGSHNRDEESDERRAIGTPPGLAETVRSLMVELQSCKADNERMMKEQEKQTEINAVLLQSLSDLQRQMQHEPEMQNRGRVSGHTERSTSRKVHPRGKGPMPEDSTEKELAIQKALLAVGPVPIPKRNRRSKRLLRVINLRNLERPNLPPSMVR